MATVPTYDGLRVGGGAAGFPTFDTSAPSGAGAVGQGIAEAGQGLANAGAALVRIQEAANHVTDTVRVNDAINKVRATAQRLTYDPQQGYAALKGAAALYRPDGQGLDDEYGAKLRQQIDDLGAGLGNDRQREAFRQRAGELLTGFKGDVLKHVNQEFRAHTLSVDQGTIKLSAEDAARNWKDADKVDVALGQIRAAVVQQGATAGWSAAQTDAASQLAVSKVHTDVVLEALAAGNPAYAQGYLDSRRGQMVADDILRVQGHVTQQVVQAQAQSTVQQVTQQAMPQFAPGGFDRMVAITRQSESGGREFGPDGQILTSPKGAKGSMQVLDSTMAAPGLGLQPLDPKTATPEQRARFGGQYLQALLQKYGDPAKAWAAYNAGPGALDKAMKQAEQDAPRFRGPVPADLWLQKLPAETQAYVAKNMDQLQKGGGIGAPPTELEFIQRAVQALPPGSTPQLVAATQAAAKERFGVINKSMAETGDAAVSAAQRWLMSNPGATVDRLPPQITDALRQFAPGKVDDLVAYAKAVGNPDTTTDLVVYNRLAGNPELLRRMTDAQFEGMRARLSPADFKHFASERGALLNPKAGDTSGNLDTSAITSATNDHLRVLGIDPTPKDDGGADAARIGAIRKEITDQVLRAQAQTGKKLDDAQVRALVGQAFARPGLLSHWWGKDETQPQLAMKASDIPSKVRDALGADMRRAGVANPTDAQLLGAYWTAMRLKQGAR